MNDVVDQDRALAVAVTDAQWHHVAVVDDSKELVVYLDGTVIGRRAIVDTTRNTAAGYVIGGWPDPNRYFKGFLAGVQFYNATVTAVDVSNVMTSTRPGKPPFVLSQTQIRSYRSMRVVVPPPLILILTGP